ncbi:hypothetical protein I317_00197 [Kwoniella heveanensis CBS 569]|nr:hypothetical protein I317_00197 [Kwoniella heveanensis CBS 569]
MADNEYYEYNAGNDQPEDEWPETVWDPNHSYQGTEDPYRTAQGPAGTYVPPAPLLNQNEILMASNPPSYDPCDATQRASLRRVFSDESRLQSQAIE